VLAVSTVAFSASRSSSDSTGERGSVAQMRTATQVQGAVTMHRLLRDSLRFSLMLSEALRLLEQPAVAEPEYGTSTIIDEPDPAGLGEGTQPPPENGGEGSGADLNESEESLSLREGVPVTQFG
jgi:hypothetical protein